MLRHQVFQASKKHWSPVQECTWKKVYLFFVYNTWQAYNSSDVDKKKGLIAKYKAEGGIKNLAWVTTYVEKSKEQEINEIQV